MEQRKIYISDISSAVELVRFFSYTAYDADFETDCIRKRDGVY